MAPSPRACALLACLLFLLTARAEDEEVNVPERSARLLSALVPLIERDGVLTIDREAWETWKSENPEFADESDPAHTVLLNELMVIAGGDTSGSVGVGWESDGVYVSASGVSTALVASLFTDSSDGTLRLHLAERGGRTRSLHVTESSHAGLQVVLQDPGTQASVVLRASPVGHVLVFATRGGEEFSFEGKGLAALPASDGKAFRLLVAIPLAEIGVFLPSGVGSPPEPRGLGAPESVAAKWREEALKRPDGSVCTIQCDRSSQHCIAFTADGKRLLVAGRDGNVKAWSTEDWALARTYADAGFAILLSPDGRHLAGLLFDGVQVIDLESGNEVFSTNEGGMDFAFGDGGAVIATFVRDKSGGRESGAYRVAAWEVESGRQLWASDPVEFGGMALSSVPEGGAIALVRRREKKHGLVVLDARSGSVVRQWDLAHLGTHRISWGKDGKTLFCAWRISSVCALDASDGHPLRLVDPAAWTAFPSPDGSRIALGGRNTVQVRDAASARLIAWFPTNGMLAAADWSPDGAFLATVTREDVVKVWRVPK